MLLLLRLLLAPTLVALASVAVARFGARVGGLLASLPVVGGPILLLFALEQGTAFAEQASSQTILGVVPLCVYSVLYARLSGLSPQRRWILVCLLSSVVGYLAVAWLLGQLSSSLGMNLVAALTCLAFGYRLIPRQTAPPSSTPVGGPSGLATLVMRMGAAAILVFALTTTARLLGPDKSGLLVPFPVASTVLVVGTHLTLGPEGVSRLLAGFLVGLVGFVAFLAVLSVGLSHLGIAWGFSAALLASLSLQSIFLIQVWQQRRPGGRSM
jgi:hypothetical protein